MTAVCPLCKDLRDLRGFVHTRAAYQAVSEKDTKACRSGQSMIVVDIWYSIRYFKVGSGGSVLTQRVP
jgi:hypothetical protein